MIRAQVGKPLRVREHAIENMRAFKRDWPHHTFYIIKLRPWVFPWYQLVCLFR